MKKRILAILSALFVVASFTAPALAAVTFHKGPSFTDLGGDYTVNLYADASGLGNTNLVGTIDFSGTVQYTCQNKGGNIAPGQPFVYLQPAVTQSVSPDKSGRAVVDLTASFSPPSTVSGTTAGCPNGKWIGINPVVIGPVSATGTITRGNQQLFQQIISPVTP